GARRQRPGVSSSCPTSSPAHPHVPSRRQPVGSAARRGMISAWPLGTSLGGDAMRATVWMGWVPGCLLGATLLLLGGAACGPAAAQDWDRLRQRMVAEQLQGRDIDNKRVLAAMTKLPRHEFVPAAQRALAYGDGPLPIGHEQTISQPYIVALMTQ